MGKKVERTMYKIPYEAVYMYETPNYDGTFTRWDTRVDVVGETTKSYFIRLRTELRGHIPGDVIRVMKKKVRFYKAPHDTSQFWYNNFESRELTSPI